MLQKEQQENYKWLDFCTCSQGQIVLNSRTLQIRMLCQERCDLTPAHEWVEVMIVSKGTDVSVGKQLFSTFFTVETARLDIDALSSLLRAVHRYEVKLKKQTKSLEQALNFSQALE